MRIVMDLQGAQSEGSRHRGIGRYTLSLAMAAARNHRGHDIHLILNGAFAEQIPVIRQAFEGCCHRSISMCSMCLCQSKR